MPKHVVKFRHYAFFIMLILLCSLISELMLWTIESFLLSRCIISGHVWHITVDLGLKTLLQLKRTFRFIFLCSTRSHFWRISTYKVSFLFFSIVSQIAIGTGVKTARMFTPTPWCRSDLISFCEFRIHQRVFWQKLRASFATKKRQLVFKTEVSFLNF